MQMLQMLLGMVNMNADEIAKHNAKHYPYCGKCYTGVSIGKWGHCTECELKRVEYEHN
jgi:hypothetical protein